MLKLIYDNESEIPEALRSYYEKGDDGKYRLKVEGGAVSAEKLKEFRDKNTELLKQAERFKDVNLDEYQALKAMKTNLESGKLDAKAEEIVTQRIEAFKKEQLKAVTELTTERDRMSGELARLKIGDAAVAEALKLGLRGGAKDDLIARVSAVFKLEGGVPVAYGPDGKQLYDGQAEPLKVADYVKGLIKSAEHLFDPSAGTGAGGGKGKQDTGGVNPWKKETFNLTLQGKINRENPEEAKRLKAAAGA